MKGGVEVDASYAVKIPVFCLCALLDGLIYIGNIIVLHHFLSTPWYFRIQFLLAVAIQIFLLVRVSDWKRFILLNVLHLGFWILAVPILIGFLMFMNLHFPATSEWLRSWIL